MAGQLPDERHAEVEIEQSLLAFRPAFALFDFVEGLPVAVDGGRIGHADSARIAESFEIGQLFLRDAHRRVTPVRSITIGANVDSSVLGSGKKAAKMAAGKNMKPA